MLGMAVVVGSPVLQHLAGGGTNQISFYASGYYSSSYSLTINEKKRRRRKQQQQLIINSSNRFLVNEFPPCFYHHYHHHLSPLLSSSASAAYDSIESNLDHDDFTNNNHHHHQDLKQLTAIASTGAGTEGSKTVSAGSFSRLKAHKIRSLALKTAKMMRDVKCYDNDIIVQEVGAEPESLEKEGFNVSKCNTTVSRRESKTRQGMDRSEAVIEPGVQQLSQHQPASPKSSQAVNGDNVAVSRLSSTPLRGWDAGRGGSTRWVRSEYTDRAKQSWKVPADNSFFSQKSFREVGCSDNLIEFLRSQQIQRPSHIQALAFAPVLGLKSCIITDQSGSGKTLAYLLPVIQRIRQEELEGLGKSLPQSPRVVILVPTAELACQVLTNCRGISKYGVPFRSIVATGGFSQKTQLESLRQNLDVIVATPGRFMFLIQEGLLLLSNLTCAVLDEVDILFNDEDYEPALQSLIESSPVTTQYLFVTATLPTDIYNKLVEVFPDCEMIMGPGMHRTSPGLEEILVDCSGDEGTSKTPDTAFDNKRSALLKLVKDIPVAKTIIFCNKIETCRKVENVLKRVDRKGIHAKVLPFHSALAKESQLANMEEFCSPQLDTSLFLVCTDRASRGIDFKSVDHVVLFDYPRDPSEYVRRVGRTARGAGKKGKAFVFVVGKQVSLARRVIERNRKGRPLHDLPCEYYDSV